MSLPWFRLYAEFAGDPLIQSLAFEDQRHYVVILCLKCDGVLDRNIPPKAKTRIINRALGLDSATADEVKRRLIEVGLVTEKWQPKGWSKRQFKSDNSSERVRKHRKSKEQGNVPPPLQKRDGNAPDTEADTEAERKEKLQKKIFSPPSVSDVAEYCESRSNEIDPEYFVDHYTANGWKVGGKAPMKDWKAAVRNWERRAKADKPKELPYGAGGE